MIVSELGCPDVYDRVRTGLSTRVLMTMSELRYWMFMTVSGPFCQ